MKRLSQLFLITMLFILPIWSMSEVHAADIENCSDECSCCLYMMEHLGDFGHISSAEEAVGMVMSFPAATVNPTAAEILQEMLYRYDAFAFGNAWFYGQGKLSYEEMCDWGTNGEVCYTGCELAGSTSYQSCTGELQWTENEANTEIASELIFICNTCFPTENYLYRCQSGFYGRPADDGLSGCNPCPNPGTSLPGTTSMYSCYIPKGTFTEESGSGNYLNNCYYIKQ